MKEYELADLISDPSFVDWVCNDHEDARRKWKAWIRQHPDKYSLVEEARDMVLTLEMSRKQRTEEEIHARWKQLEKQLPEEHASAVLIPLNGGREAVSPENMPERRRLMAFRSHGLKLSWIGAAAAVVLLLGLALALLPQWLAMEKAVYVPFGATRTMELPDGSTVTLNGNSSLRFDRWWSGNGPREVWLEGEAYFDVVHLGKHHATRFLVHTPTVTVEVLGTTFNVSQRTGKTRVVLNTGKIKLSHESLEDTVTMEPGDMVELTGTLVKKKVEPTQYISWTYRKLIFDETSIQEVAELIANTYGYEVDIKGEELSKRTLSGEAVVNSVEDLKELLISILPDINIEEQNRKLIFEMRR